MSTPDPESWKLVATGEGGDHLTWVDGFKSIEEARSYLMMLEGDAYASVDWSALLQNLPDLENLTELDAPPLYSEQAFEDLGGFLVMNADPIDDSPGRSFNQIELYIDVDYENNLVNQFSVLAKRLEETFAN